MHTRALTLAPEAADELTLAALKTSDLSQTLLKRILHGGANRVAA